jgi:hypothetical protein
VIVVKEINPTELVISEANGKYHIEACVDEDGEPFLVYAKVINVQVVKGKSPKWYANRVNEIFEVVELTEHYLTIGHQGVIDKGDAMQV